LIALVHASYPGTLLDGPYWHLFGKFHPALAHFPIALLVVAALVESWSILRRQRKPIGTTLVCLYIGAAAAVVSTLLGWADANVTGDKGTTVDLHRWLGVTVAGFAVVSVILSIIVLRRTKSSWRLIWSYRAGVLASAALVGLVGSFGGKLVHGETYYSDAYALLQQELAQGTQEIAKPVASDFGDVRDFATVSPTKIIDKVSGETESVKPQATTKPIIQNPAVDGGQVAAATALAPSPSTTRPAAPDIAPPGIAAAVGFGGGQIDYARDIEPIFQANCVKCHNEIKKKGGYRLDERERVFAAGQSGKVAVLPGKSDESLLVKMIEGKGEFADSIMPPKGPPLTFQQIALIRRWIDEGALSSSP
jgi:uncharacterized membrane protein